jgi:predicted transcriptional regulator
MDEDGDQTTSRQVLDFLTTHPGASAREVQRSLSLGWGQTVYHLEHLLRKSLLTRERAGRRDYYFAGNICAEDRRILVAFQSPVERMLILLLARKPGRSFSELAEELHMGKSTLSFHLKYLLGVGVVGLSTADGVRRYHAEQPGRVWDLYRMHRKSWGDRWIEGFDLAFGIFMRD